MNKILFATAAIVTFASVASTASAQTFPANDRYAPLPCRDGYMTDAHRDQSTALRERDIVGDNLAYAGYRASDAQFLYLRMRLDDDPAPGGTPRPFSWGFEISTDSVLNSYEVLILLNGSTKTIAVHRNSVMTTPDDPNDPADEPPVATYPFASHGRTSIAPSSKYGGDNDYFLDLAIPWSALEPLGATKLAPLYVWAATSSNATGLNGDFACHDGTRGAPRLTPIASRPTTLDPNVDSDGDGWTDAVEVSSGTNPNSAASKPAGTPPVFGEDPVLAGAGGCAYGATGPSGFLLALALAGWAARRRRATPSTPSRER